MARVSQLSPSSQPVLVNHNVAVRYLNLKLLAIKDIWKSCLEELFGYLEEVSLVCEGAGDNSQYCSECERLKQYLQWVVLALSAKAILQRVDFILAQGS